MLIPQVDSEKEPDLWNMYLDEVKEEDSQFTDSWKDDASSILTFVSHNLLGPCVHLSDKLQDRSSLRNCWRIHHRILQKVIPRFWRSNSGSSSADFTPASQFPKWHQFQHGESTVISRNSHDLGHHTVVDKPCA